MHHSPENKRAYVDAEKCSEMILGTINDMLEVEQHGELVNKTHRKDDELPLVGLADSNSASRLSQQLELLSRLPPSRRARGLLSPVKVGLADSYNTTFSINTRGSWPIDFACIQSSINQSINSFAPLLLSLNPSCCSVRFVGILDGFTGPRRSSMYFSLMSLLRRGLRAFSAKNGLYIDFTGPCVLAAL